jgi:hypothetical protein
MSPSLDGIRAKLARADQHIKQINDDRLGEFCRVAAIRGSRALEPPQRR